MDIWTVIIIAIALGIDSFSVCIGIGMCGIQKRKMYLITILVAFFHIVMPLLGMFIGQQVGERIGSIAELFGAMVFLVIGSYYLFHYFRERMNRRNISCMEDTSLIDRPFGVIIMASSVSLDALAVGFGLGAIGMHVVKTVLIMGAVAGIMTYGGLVLGKKIGNFIGNHAELVGGILLLGVAVYFLVNR